MGRVRRDRRRGRLVRVLLDPVLQRQRSVGRSGRQVRRPEEHDGLRAQPALQLRQRHVRVGLQHHGRHRVHEERQRLRHRVPRGQRDRRRGRRDLQEGQGIRNGKRSNVRHNRSGSGRVPVRSHELQRLEKYFTLYGSRVDHIDPLGVISEKVPSEMVVIYSHTTARAI